MAEQRKRSVFPIRELKPKDLTEVADLSGTATTTHWPKYPDLKGNTAYHRETYERVLRTPNHYAIGSVDTQHRRIVGVSYMIPFVHALAHAPEDFPAQVLQELKRRRIAHEKVAYFGGANVHDDYANRGISSDHRDERESEARKRGFTHVLTYTSPDTKIANNLPVQPNVGRLTRHGYETIFKGEYDGGRPDVRMEKHFYLKAL